MPGPRKFKMQPKHTKRTRKNKKPWNPNPNGRPIELDEDVIDHLCNLVKRVVYIETAGNYLGIDRESINRWARNGRQLAKKVRANPDLATSLTNDEVLYIKFYVRLKKAVAEAEVDRLKIIDNASKKVWTAAAWVLERTRPHKYGNQSREIRDLQREMKALLKAMGGQPKEVSVL